MSLAPLLFLRLMADRALNPGAVELHAGKGDLSALTALFEGENFAAFSESFPCFFGTDLEERSSPELLQSLQNLGCHFIKAQVTHHSDEHTKPALPPTAEWLIGNWYLEQPAKPSGTQTASRALSLKLLQQVATDADTFEIEAIFRQEPTLAYHLLRLVNSLGTGVGRHISSFSQAILILGRQQLKRWLNLMLFAANHNDYRSAMLLARVTVRARSMELLASAIGLDRTQQEQAFIIGMFSLLGTLFGMPLPEILNPLKLDDSLSKAVLQREGVLGSLLRAVEYAEQANDEGLTEQLAGLPLSSAEFNEINTEAHRWMLDVIHDKRDAVDA